MQKLVAGILGIVLATVLVAYGVVTRSSGGGGLLAKIPMPWFFGIEVPRVFVIAIPALWLWGAAELVKKGRAEIASIGQFAKRIRGGEKPRDILLQAIDEIPWSDGHVKQMARLVVEESSYAEVVRVTIKATERSVESVVLLYKEVVEQVAEQCRLIRDAALRAGASAERLPDPSWPGVRVASVTRGLLKRAKPTDLAVGDTIFLYNQWLVESVEQLGVLVTRTAGQDSVPLKVVREVQLTNHHPATGFKNTTIVSSQDVLVAGGQLSATLQNVGTSSAGASTSVRFPVSVSEGSPAEPAPSVDSFKSEGTAVYRDVGDDGSGIEVSWEGLGNLAKKSRGAAGAIEYRSSDSLEWTLLAAFRGAGHAALPVLRVDVSDTATIKCPNCTGILKLRNTSLLHGKRAQCNKCSAIFVVSSMPRVTSDVVEARVSEAPDSANAESTPATGEALMPYKVRQDIPKWTDVFVHLTSQARKGVGRPALWMWVQKPSMAVSLLVHRPGATKSMVVGVPEMCNFSDGSAAAVFCVESGSAVPPLLRAIAGGSYGNDKPVVNGGAAASAPSSDQRQILSMFGRQEGLSADGVLMW